MPTFKNEVYLGEGLYASFDGYQFLLRAPREEGDHFVALEPAVHTAYVEFVERTLKKRRSLVDAQMTLDDFVSALDAISNVDKPAWFDFGSAPGSFASYRGYYDQLALSYVAGSEQTLSVISLLAQARTAIGSRFTGYKGGTFVMGPDTPLWASNYGDVSDLAIIGVEEHDDKVVILTVHKI